MREVLISIQAEHNANIESGRKTEELRTRVPKCELPIKFYTYESGKNGRHKVTNEWICREIMEYSNPDRYPISLQDRACVPFSYICDYAKDGEKILYGLVITDLVVYDDPRELSEFFQVKAIRGYHKKDEPKTDGINVPKILQSSRIEVNFLTRPPQSWCYIEPRKTAD